ncbi:mRNA 3'-end-processing protein rna14 [Physocladia obscura]|uniref:mRNA 3'-end-processing protein rna14 n=1 Tax=Physocladia obscura TaxID=109957 RepID=A0AAD5XA73_9FUNG|nr:mRNA 3'-end-processing protein rna14 [Physocladia obscura]
MSRTQLQQLRGVALADDSGGEAWDAYIEAATADAADNGAATEAFEAAVARFPSSARLWSLYIDTLLARRHFAATEALFSRCLRAVVSVSIWLRYLNYIKDTHSSAVVPAERRAESYQTVLKAFDLVLANVGLDKDAGSIWLDYFAYIKSVECTSKYEEQQMMELRRKAFQKAISIPLANVETIWKEYDSFENSLNKLTAKKLLSERSAGYMTARTAFRELKIITAPIDAAQPTWLPSTTTWSETDFDLLRAWKRLIAWEKSNPLRTEDMSIVSSRVVYAYKSSLLMMRYFPELWHDAARYLIDLGKTDEAVAVLHQAVEAIPRSLLLNFALAELEESLKKNFDDIAKIFDTLISNLEEWVVEVNRKYDQERDTLLTLLRGSEVNVDTSDWDGERREQERDKEKERNAEVEQKVEKARKKKLQHIKEAWSLAWVVYMRVARRAQNVSQARKLFKLARKSDLCTFHVYVASALMEYYSSKDVVIACKIFELGMKAFAEDASLPQFVCHYLDFLIQMNDENNARALFERALVALSPDKARMIWSRFFMNEINNGDLANILKIEKRMRDSYPDDDDYVHSTKLIADRWSFLDIQFIGTEELGIKDTILLGVSKSKLGSDITAIDTSFQRPKNLDPIFANQIVQPDLSKWTAYRPEPRDKPLVPVKVLPPAKQAPQVPQNLSTNNAPQNSNSSAAPKPVLPVVLMVPESVSFVLDRLPPASSYNGPNLPINELIDALRRLPLPTPQPGSKMVPLSIDPSKTNFGDQSGTGLRQSRFSNSNSSGGKRKGAGGIAGFDSDENYHKKR